ncbi:unnamed protein product, partial [Musa textilis]
FDHSIKKDKIRIFKIPRGKTIFCPKNPNFSLCFAVMWPSPPYRRQPLRGERIGLYSRVARTRAALPLVSKHYLPRAALPL